MTVGNPATNLIRFSTPLLIGNLAQQLYSTVDSIVVGNYVGDSALAAIGASGPIINLLLVLFMGVSVGASIMASQYFGAKDKKRLSHSVGTAITATFAVSIFVMVVGPLITHPIMSALQTPQDIYTMSCDYLIINFLGILGSAYYNIISGILRGLGDSVMPLIFLLVACGMNIGLDIWFVAGFKMGVAGAAWATIISQAVSGILCLVRLLLMRDVLHITWRTLWPTKALLFQLIRLGLPSGLTQAVFSLAMMPNFTFGTATTTFTGQNIGAGRLDRVEKGTKDGLKLGLSVSVVLVALILFFGRYLMEMFTSTPDVIDTGMHMMRILSIGYIAMAVTQILSGVMRGAGDTMTPMWISLITTIVIRVPIAYGLAALMHSADALFISLLISWVMGAVLTSIAFRMGRWKKKSIINDDVPESADVQV